MSKMTQVEIALSLKALRAVRTMAAKRKDQAKVRELNKRIATLEKQQTTNGGIAAEDALSAIAKKARVSLIENKISATRSPKVKRELKAQLAEYAAA